MQKTFKEVNYPLKVLNKAKFNKFGDGFPQWVCKNINMLSRVTAMKSVTNVSCKRYTMEIPIS